MRFRKPLLEKRKMFFASSGSQGSIKNKIREIGDIEARNLIKQEASRNGLNPQLTLVMREEILEVAENICSAYEKKYKEKDDTGGKPLVNLSNPLLISRVEGRAELIDTLTLLIVNQKCKGKTHAPRRFINDFVKEYHRLTRGRK